jgi:hypothetical protein
MVVAGPIKEASRGDRRLITLRCRRLGRIGKTGHPTRYRHGVPKKYNIFPLPKIPLLIRASDLTILLFLSKTVCHIVIVL